MLQVQGIRALHEVLSKWGFLHSGTQWPTRKEARGISRTAEAPRRPRRRQAFKLGLGRAKSPRRDPHRGIQRLSGARPLLMVT